MARKPAPKKKPDVIIPPPPPVSTQAAGEQKPESLTVAVKPSEQRCETCGNDVTALAVCPVDGTKVPGAEAANG